MTQCEFLLSERKESYDREYHAAKKAERNEVGAIPPVADPALRARCTEGDDALQTFLIEMFGEIFSDPFGDVQISSIRQEQRMHRLGAGRLNKLEPRGYGKTVRSCLGALHAILCGSQNFVVVCSESVEKSDDLIKLITSQVCFNQKLLSAFPELYPFHLIEGNPHRGSHQTFKGKKTNISIKGDTIQFPELPGVPSSGAVIVARPYKKTRGKMVEGRRPTMVILDDIQSTEDAISPTSIEKNLKILFADIAFLGSRKRQVAIINNATIIAADDMPDRLSRNRAFVTVKYRMVESMPSDDAMSLWEVYREMRERYDENIPGDDIRAKQSALEFYKSHRVEMDAGSKVTWDYAFSASSYQCSTIQAAMDFIFDYGMDAFLSECQNEPKLSDGEVQPLRPEEVEKKVVGVDRRVVPEECDTITAFIDVSEKVLWWWVIATGRKDFTTHVLDYGVYPDQRAAHVTLATVKRTMRQRFPGDFKSALVKSLDDLADMITGQAYISEGGGEMYVSLIGIDSGWGEYSTDVYRYIRRSRHRSILRATKGMGITAKRNPLVDPTIKPKSRESIEGQWKSVKTKVGIPLLLYDTNTWKSRVLTGIRYDVGTPGSATLFQSASHRMAIEQLCSERPDRVSANGRTIDEFSLVPGRDNHFFDCMCGAMVLAHVSGSRYASRKVAIRRKSQKPKPEDKQSSDPKPKSTSRRQRQRNSVVF